MNKKFIIILMIALSLSLVGCSGKSVEPTYENLDQQMHIGAFVAPPNTKGPNGEYLYINEEHYQMIKDSGIQTIYGLYEAAEPAAILEALRVAEVVGINYYVYHWTLRGLFQGVIDENGNRLEEEIADDFEIFKSVVDQYTPFESFKGVLIYDEPSAELYDGFAIYKEKFDEYLPDKDFYINLFPTYSSRSARGNVTYEEYIDQYLNVVKPDFLSYDHYPLMLFYEESVLTDDYLFNLELISNKTKAANVPFWLFIQTISYSNFTGTQTRRPAEDDIRWQVAVSMAYGVRGIQHFTYWTPTDGSVEQFTDGMIDREGNRTDLYYAAQKINLEVLNFDHIYLDFIWEGVLAHSVDKSNINANFRMIDALDSHKRISSINSEEDVLIGTFKDSNNNDGFMVVNYTDPFYDLSNEVNIKFKNAKKAIVIIKGEKTVVDLTKGTLTLELESGEGVFVIPF